MNTTGQLIADGKTVLGIELGSTRIKAVLIDENHMPVASGSYEWENRFENGVWTYSLEDIHTGLRTAYQNLAANVKAQYNVTLTCVKAIGISGMMHGYLAFDKDGNLLAPFRTWRNTITEEASAELTGLFNYNIPQRWSVAHLYQAVLNKEEHVKDISYLTTLSGYIHWLLTGNKVLGIGDASGMFPIDIETRDYDKSMMADFNEVLREKGILWEVESVLPKVLVAGEEAGVLTEKGAGFLDPDGNLKSGIPMAPPEGDAGTGMTATNSVAQRTGNISAGTSIFAMIVLEKKLSKIYPELDLVTTPDGSLVAMVHANNGTSDLNAWVGIFKEFAECLGSAPDTDDLYSMLYSKALEGDPDCGGLLSYGYLSGEHITGCSEGRPLFVRSAESRFNLANFMRSHLYASLGAIRLGMDILLNEENVRIDKIYGHGGFFKTKGVGQRFLAAAINTPVFLMETAGEGGPWGMAILASYMINKAPDESLGEYLSSKVFANGSGTGIAPDPADTEGFTSFAKRYKEGIAIEQAAIKNLVL